MNSDLSSNLSDNTIIFYNNNIYKIIEECDNYIKVRQFRKILDIKIDNLYHKYDRLNKKDLILPKLNYIKVDIYENNIYTDYIEIDNITKKISSLSKSKFLFKISNFFYHITIQLFDIINIIKVHPLLNLFTYKKFKDDVYTILKTLIDSLDLLNLHRLTNTIKTIQTIANVLLTSYKIYNMCIYIKHILTNNNILSLDDFAH